MRIRKDIGGLTLGSRTAARTQAWDPVLDTYARGVQLMKDLDDGGPVPASWRWAANTHGMEIVPPPLTTWGQCQHQTLYFLPWHRAYLAWFEGTIRELTGEDDWALPYWDYSDPASDRRIPAEFTVTTRTVDGDVVPNPLFSRNRSSRPLPLANVDLAPALSQPNFVLQMEYGFGGVLPDQYSGLAEQRPHNFVHGDIGGRLGEMGSTVTAGRDPIFWLHHANIDRIWEIWRSLEGSVELADSPLATGALLTQWRSAEFWFGDEQNPATYSMADVEDLSSAPMDYEYESIELPAGIADDVLAERARVLAEQDGGLGLEGAPEWTPVAASFDLPSGEERAIELEGGLGLDAAPPSRLMVELAGTTAQNPHPSYAVEIRIAPGAEPHVIGRFSTFGLAGTPDDETRNYLVDATSALPALLAEGWTGGELIVTVIPEPEPESEPEPEEDVEDEEEPEDEGGGRGLEDEGRPEDAGPLGIRISQVTIYTQTP